MANVMPTVATTWSTSVWYDADTNTPIGRLPDSGDAIYLNGRNLTLNQNISIYSISSYAYGFAVSGGNITVSTGGYSITTISNISGGNGNNTGAINITHTTGGNTSVICGGTISGRTDTGGTNGYFGINITIGAGNSCDVTFANIVEGGFASGNGNNYGIGINSAGSITLTKTGGNWKSTIAYNRAAIQALIQSGGSLTVNCNIDSNALGTEKDFFMTCVPIGLITLNGYAFGSNVSGGNSSVIIITGGGITTSNGFIHNGNAKAGNYGSVVNINSANTRYKNLQTCKGASNYTFAAINANQPTAVIDLNNVEADGAGAVSSNVVNEIIVRGDYKTKNGIQAIVAPKWRLDPTTTATYTFQKEDNSDLVLNNTNTDIGQPSENDVRKDVVFGSANQFTGKVYIPNKSYVASGVLVDVSDTGTLSAASATEIANAVWNKATSELTTSGSTGERFLNQATIDSTAQQIIALK